MSNEIYALNNLVKNYLHFLKPEDCNDLENMLSPQTTDLGDTISNWMKQHEHLRPTYLELLKQSNTTKGAGGTGGEPPSLEELAKLQQEIINTIRVPSPQNNKPSESK